MEMDAATTMLECNGDPYRIILSRNRYQQTRYTHPSCDILYRLDAKKGNTRNMSSSKNRSSPLVQALNGGILVHAPNGLCLYEEGLKDSGVYTSLTRLAATLTPAATETTNPLITLELEHDSSILVKEYDGHTVAMKVPNKKPETPSSSPSATGDPK